MARHQRARALRAALAVAALVAAVVGEAAVGRALADRGAEEAERAPAARAALLPPRALPHPRAGRGVQGEALRAAFRNPDVPAADVLRRLPARLSPKGVAITVGSTRAPVTVTFYEDYRCPDCRRFEQRQGAMLAGLAADGTVLIRRVFESSLDVRLPGDGAHRASNAARAALEAGAFPLYNALLYENQPPERQNGFTVARLLDLASRVPGLRSRRFDEAVRTQRYASWVDASQRAYDRYGKRIRFGTPAMVVNGRTVDLGARPELATDPHALSDYLKAAARRR